MNREFDILKWDGDRWSLFEPLAPTVKGETVYNCRACGSVFSRRHGNDAVAAHTMAAHLSAEEARRDVLLAAFAAGVDEATAWRWLNPEDEEDWDENPVLAPAQSGGKRGAR